MPALLVVTTIDATLEAFLIPFAVHLRRAGWRVEALANSATSNTRLLDTFDECYDIQWTREPLSRGSVLSPRRVREVVSAGEYDFVWVHTPVAALVTRFALHRAKHRPVIVYTAHGFHFHRGGRSMSNTVYRLIERAAAGWTDYIVTINEEDYRAALEFGTIDASRIRLIPGIGVNPEEHTPGTKASADVALVRDELTIGSNSFMITLVAEFTANKRHVLALEALGLLSDPDAVLVFVGSGPLEPIVRREAARRGLSTRVRFAGFRRDIPAILATTNLLLLCSKREGLNRSGLEAMASGVPIVGTPTRGIVDLIGQDDAGWVSASHTASDLAAAIDAAMANPAERSRRGESGRKRVAELYALERILLQYDSVFADALRELDS